MTAPEDLPRLQKALAHAGVASRRACEALITGGRVEVNGELVFEMGTRINPATDEVRVDGVVMQLDPTKRYFILNKPRGVVSTMRDEQRRPDLRSFVEPTGERLFNVGRLDTETSGLLVLTNDGDLAHRLAHPKFGVQKTYVAKVRGLVTPAVIQRLRDGVELDDGPIRADAAKLLRSGASRTHSLVEITLHSGRNRIVRRLLAAVGHPVDELVRRQFGPLHLGSQRLGEMRELSAAERGALLSAGGGSGVVGVVDVDDMGGDVGSGSGGGAGTRGAGSDAGESGAGTGGDAAEGGAGTGGDAGGSGAGIRGARGAQGEDRDPTSRISAGRPGDGKGARGMRGVAARGGSHGRR